MTRNYYSSNYTIVYNGELYNTDELREDLKAKGHTFQTTCDTEVILIGFIEYGPDFVKKLTEFLPTLLQTKETMSFIYSEIILVLSPFIIL